VEVGGEEADEAAGDARRAGSAAEWVRAIGGGGGVWVAGAGRDAAWTQRRWRGAQCLQEGGRKGV
jgi:hypothetical protein